MIHYTHKPQTHTLHTPTNTYTPQTHPLFTHPLMHTPIDTLPHAEEQ